MSSRQTSGDRPLAVVMSLLLPGAGHIARRRFLRGAVWGGGLLLSFALMPFVWQFLWLNIGLRLGAAVDSAVVRQGPGQGRHLALSAVVGIIGFIVVRLAYMGHVVELHKLPSGAMTPALVPGDYVVASNVAYAFGDPQAGDIVTFDWPCDRNVTFVSRVVATAGQTVEVRCSALYVDGQLREPAPAAMELIPGLGSQPHELDFPLAVPEFTCPDSAGQPFETERVDGAAEPCDQQLRFRVPPAHVFVVSDNIQQALDSRAFGPVRLDDLRGKVLGIWWSRR